MFIHYELLILILSLTLAGHVHTGEIIGGHDAVPHSRPYMVLLKLHMYDGKTHYCGGFLLNEDFVMTAAHCQAKSYTASLGVHNFHKSTDIQRIPVKHAFPHEAFNANDFKNDIMLLKLSSKANFTNNVKPIALAGQDICPLPKSCLVSGWGITEEDKDKANMSVVLTEANVTLNHNEQCAKDNMYCSEGEPRPGLGDSGGPLVCDEKAYGVVSISYQPDKDAKVLSYFTKIPDYSSWLYKTMTNA